MPFRVVEKRKKKKETVPVCVAEYAPQTFSVCLRQQQTDTQLPQVFFTSRHEAENIFFYLFRVATFLKEIVDPFEEFRGDWLNLKSVCALEV